MVVFASTTVFIDPSYVSGYAIVCQDKGMTDVGGVCRRAEQSGKAGGEALNGPP